MNLHLLRTYCTCFQFFLSLIGVFFKTPLLTPCNVFNKTYLIKEYLITTWPHLMFIMTGSGSICNNYTYRYRCHNNHWKTWLKVASYRFFENWGKCKYLHSQIICLAEGLLRTCISSIMSDVCRPFPRYGWFSKYRAKVTGTYQSLAFNFDMLLSGDRNNWLNNNSSISFFHLPCIYRIKA